MQSLLISDDNCRYEAVARSILTLWRPLGFGDLKKIKCLNACGFAQEFLRYGMLNRPGKSIKRRSKSSSLHSKKIFCLGVAGSLSVTS